MKKEHKNWFCFKKARWILAAAAALSLYPGSVFAEENIEVENTAAELSVEEGATPVPEKTETTEISEPAKEKSVSDDSVETKSSAQIISVDITWGNMGFVYQKGLWNPETHQYGVGTWNPDGDGSSQISISNNGTESVKAFFRNGNGENISEIALSAGDNTSAYLVLTGTPSEEFSNSVLGTVTVTIGG